MNQALEDPKPICDKSVFTYFHNVVGREAVQGGCKKSGVFELRFCVLTNHASITAWSKCLFDRQKLGKLENLTKTFWFLVI